ncbi:MAG: hypothetical protein WC848_00685 [Parcubacteria group bacterium]
MTIVLGLLLLAHRLDERGVVSAGITSAAIQEIRPISTTRDPQNINPENDFIGFEIIFTSEIQCGKFKTNVVRFSADHSTGSGLRQIFIIAGNPQHKYELQDFTIRTKDGGKSFYVITSVIAILK